ncbi:MAG: hypothetical protein J0H09_26830 [Burkholderiales bacterium]|nr:hypothetical protein [Burkholderiales bacterium]
MGFHGCDRAVGEKVLAGKQTLKPSNNDYDWLGSGIYFWEGNPARALQFAHECAENGKLTKGRIYQPFVIGAVIDSGVCCNLWETSSLDAKAHSIAKQALGTALPANHGGSDRLLRRLDRAVIEVMHVAREEQGLPAYDSVRSAFEEGEEFYPGSAFRKKSHIQIAVRNPACIKGFFLPIRRRSPGKPESRGGNDRLRNVAA